MSPLLEQVNKQELIHQSLENSQRPQVEHQNGFRTVNTTAAAATTTTATTRVALACKLIVCFILIAEGLQLVLIFMQIHHLLNIRRQVLVKTKTLATLPNTR